MADSYKQYHSESHRADEIFTDRESYLESLNLALGNFKQNRPSQILYFYGKGGIGKTGLLKECLRVMELRFHSSQKDIVFITGKEKGRLSPFWILKKKASPRDQLKK